MSKENREKEHSFVKRRERCLLALPLEKRATKEQRLFRTYSGN